jgi:hypothetical protein
VKNPVSLTLFIKEFLGHEFKPPVNIGNKERTDLLIRKERDPLFVFSGVFKFLDKFFMEPGPGPIAPVRESNTNHDRAGRPCV